MVGENSISVLVMAVIWVRITQTCGWLVLDSIHGVFIHGISVTSIGISFVSSSICWLLFFVDCLKNSIVHFLLLSRRRALIAFAISFVGVEMATVAASQGRGLHRSGQRGGLPEGRRRLRPGRRRRHRGRPPRGRGRPVPPAGDQEDPLPAAPPGPGLRRRPAAAAAAAGRAPAAPRPHADAMATR